MEERLIKENLHLMIYIYLKFLLKNTLNYFPIWREVGYESCIAGGVALLLALCAIPLYKLIAERLKSFSSYLMWLVLFLLFFGMSRIADQMTVICFVGFVSNLMGAICFYIAKKIHRRA